MYNYLSGRLRQLGLCQDDLKGPLGMSRSAISRRFTGAIPWSVDEIYKILEICRATPGEFPLYFPQQAVNKGATKQKRRKIA